MSFSVSKSQSQLPLSLPHFLNTPKKILLPMALEMVSDPEDVHLKVFGVAEEEDPQSRRGRYSKHLT
jgi:hypothetical protein